MWPSPQGVGLLPSGYALWLSCDAGRASEAARWIAVTRLTWAMLQPARSAVLAMLMPVSRKAMIRRCWASSALRPV